VPALLLPRLPFLPQSRGLHFLADGLAPIKTEGHYPTSFALVALETQRLQVAEPIRSTPVLRPDVVNGQRVSFIASMAAGETASISGIHPLTFSLGDHRICYLSRPLTI
jgi:hypothetical protein